MYTPYKVFAKIRSMSRCLPPCLFQQALVSSQVHAARLRGSQKEVVIKVLKPGVEDILTADLSFLYVTARILEFLNPQLSRTSLVCRLYYAHFLLLFCQLVVLWRFLMHNPYVLFISFVLEFRLCCEAINAGEICYILELLTLSPSLSAHTHTHTYWVGFLSWVCFPFAGGDCRRYKGINAGRSGLQEGGNEHRQFPELCGGNGSCKTGNSPLCLSALQHTAGTDYGTTIWCPTHRLELHPLHCPQS
jgi:hypothetical protein